MSTVPIPEKIDLECSTVYLIDENLCLKNSADIINYNFVALSSRLVDIEKRSSSWNNIYAKFQATSSRWLASASHLQEYSGNWNNSYTTVNTLSANWSLEFSLYYPTIMSLPDFVTAKGSSNDYTINLSYSTSYWLPWLKLNFPASNYCLDQVISLFVNFFEARPFSWNFYRELYEPCLVSNGGASITCQDCFLDKGIKLYRGCNHHGGRAGSRGCDNAYDYCTHSNAGHVSYAGCPSYGARTLKVSYNLKSYDTSVAYVRRIRFKNVNYNWQLLN